MRQARAGRFARALARHGARGILLASLFGVTALAFLGLHLAVAVVGERLGRPVPPGCAAATAGIALAVLLGCLTSRAAVVAVRRRFARSGEVDAPRSPGQADGERPRLAGSLETLPFGIVVQALLAAWQTGVLLADFGGSRTGRVTFDRGKITEIRYGAHSGASALGLMCQEPGGAFTFQPRTPAGRNVRRPGAAVPARPA